MMCALVNHISMQGLRHVSPNNRQPLLWNEVVDYVRRDVRRLWTLRDGGDFDAYLSEKFDMVCKEDFDEKQKVRSIAGAVEVPTATWCIPWPPSVRAISLPGAWSSQMPMAGTTRAGGHTGTCQSGKRGSRTASSVHFSSCERDATTTTTTATTNGPKR